MHRYVPAILTALALAVIVALVVGTYHSSKTTVVQTTLPPAVFFSRPGYSAVSACTQRNTSCAQALLSTINHQRATIGSGPLSIDWTLVHHQAGCVSASDHAAHLAQVVTDFTTFAQYAHDQFSSSCAVSRGYAGQNVGEAPGSKGNAMLADYQQMMGENHTPLGTCQFGHDCNLMQRGFRRIGIAFNYDQSLQAWLIVEDFSS